jgi:hypothetical protein
VARPLRRRPPARKESRGKPATRYAAHGRWGLLALSISMSTFPLSFLFWTYASCRETGPVLVTPCRAGENKKKLQPACSGSAAQCGGPEQPPRRRCYMGPGRPPRPVHEEKVGRRTAGAVWAARSAGPFHGGTLEPAAHSPCAPTFERFASWRRRASPVDGELISLSRTTNIACPPPLSIERVRR